MDWGAPAVEVGLISVGARQLQLVASLLEFCVDAVGTSPSRVHAAYQESPCAALWCMRQVMPEAINGRPKPRHSLRTGLREQGTQPHHFRGCGKA